MSGASATKANTNVRIMRSFAWHGVKTLFWVFLVLSALIFIENYATDKLTWLEPLGANEENFNIDQLRLYAQLLTAIFSIYFATIGIILSTGYTRLRKDIIQLLTNEQVGSVYSRVLVLSAVFCLVATALPLFGHQPGLFVFIAGTVLTLLSAMALFPLGQRLFNFFDLNQLVDSEILPKIAHHIKGAANPGNSISLANHHSKAARRALEQLTYLDDQVKADRERLEDNLTALSGDYTILLMLYLQQKHTINQQSYWFPRRTKHKQWFFAGDTSTSLALETSSQKMLIEQKPDHQWFENKIVDRLAGHIELALEVGNFDLALKLIVRFSSRISEYSQRFQFNVGMREIEKFKVIIERAFAISATADGDEEATIKVELADTWAALGSSLCLESLRHMMTFEKELKQYFETDNWSSKSIKSLPAFLQVELAYIIEYVEFEQEIEGERLSKSKYVQQLAVQKLLLYYAKVLPDICEFYQSTLPDFVGSLEKQTMSEAATQVVLSSLHTHWKLSRWFHELAVSMERYKGYTHYSEKQYSLPEIDVAKMSVQLDSARDDAIAKLGSESMVQHIFDAKQNDELPDHFGQIYFELAEACVSALEKNDESKLDKVLPMFFALAFLAADSKFTDQSLDINEEYRFHLISSVINDLACVLGFAILYGAYFDNEKLPASALDRFDSWIQLVPDKQQYLKRMVLLSNPYSFSMSASPRGLIRMNWRMSFEQRARSDGYGDRTGMTQGELHPNNIVRQFLDSHSDASHLFFAKQVIPQLDSIDFEIDYQIDSLARDLQSEEGLA